MNLVSHLRRRRRSKNTRTESGLIRVNFLYNHSHVNFVIIIRIQNLIPLLSAPYIWLKFALKLLHGWGCLRYSWDLPRDFSKVFTAIV